MEGIPRSRQAAARSSLAVTVSVSYTHLDVYKRQAVYRTELGAVTAETMDEAFLERVTVGDDYLKEAQSKMLEAANLAEEIES